MNEIIPTDTEQKVFQEDITKLTKQQKIKAPKKPIDPKKAINQKRRHKKIKKIILQIIFIALIIAAIFFGLNFFKKKESTLTSNLTTSKVEKRDITVSLNGSGTLEPTDSYTVSALVKGEVLKAPFAEGDIIKEDSLMFQIDSDSLDSSIERAELSVERAQNSYDDLIDDLDDLALYADYTGIIQKVDVEVGDNINTGTIIAQVLDKSEMICEVSFFAEDTKKFSEGENATLLFDQGVETLTGVIDEISSLSTVNSFGSRTRIVKIKVKNPGGITDSSFATATINGISCSEGGYFKYRVQENIVADLSGKIDQLYIKEGQQINRDDLVLKLDSSSLDTQIKSADISLKDAKSVLKNALDQKNDYDILAPISGTVVSKNYEEGELIDPTTGTALAVIYDMSALKFTMNISELDISKIALGQEVQVTSDARPGESYTGTVTKISIQGNSTNGTTSYPATITLKSAENLLPGMNVDADIFIQKHENVLALPSTAILRSNKVQLIVDKNTVIDPKKSKNDKDAVKSMPDGTKYKEVTVSLGVNDDDYVEILSGISENDEVILQSASTNSFMQDMMASMPMGSEMSGSEGFGKFPAGSGAVPGGTN